MGMLDLFYRCSAIPELRMVWPHGPHHLSVYFHASNANGAQEVYRATALDATTSDRVYAETGAWADRACTEVHFRKMVDGVSRARKAYGYV